MISSYVVVLFVILLWVYTCYLGALLSKLTQCCNDLSSMPIVIALLSFPLLCKVNLITYILRY